MTNETIFNIINFGAVPDGKTLCSEAFVLAIKACEQASGGTVYVPAGTFLTGPIHFVSNMTLKLDAGAKVLFSQNKQDYPRVYSRWEGAECEAYSPNIYGKGLENVSIIGQGILDGQGKYWWDLFLNKTLDYPRPRFVCFEQCNRVLIDGIKLMNSPSWTINPIMSENLTINNISIKNPADSPNTDGINPESCKNVHISNCHVDVGDDCVTLKSGTQDCEKRVPCENITITNCTMVHGHGGIVIGSEMSGGVRNVVISNCIFEGTDRGIRIKSRRGRGGLVEDIRVSNIIMKKVICPIVLHLFYFCGAGGKEQYVWDKNPQTVNETTPIFRRIHFSDITAREVRAAAGFIYGLPEMPAEEITFDNISIAMDPDATPAFPAMMTDLEEMKQRGFICSYAKGITFTNVHVSGHEGPAFSVQNAQDIEFGKCSGEGLGNEGPVILLNDVNGALLEGCSAKNNKIFLELKGTGNKDIELGGNGKNISLEKVKLTDGAVKESLSM